MANKKQEGESLDPMMVVGAIRAAAVVVSSAVFYTQRVSLVPPFDAKEQPFDAGKLFDEALTEFLSE